MLDNQEHLKAELQAASPGDVENLVAALCGQLLNVPIAIARTGFQHGGDAGPAGRQDRRFRLECKRYSDTSNLDRRELLGEIDQALARDEALEAWVLVATQAVPEQLAQDITQHGQRLGVPVLILDWQDHAIAQLSALCASAPDIVQKLLSTDAATHARALQSDAAQAIVALRRDLQSWCLGFVTLRLQSHERLQKIWNLPHECNAALSQNAAGGALPKRVRRTSIHRALASWWSDTSSNCAPAAVVGSDGVGKTWATLDWLIDSKDVHPIVLVVPASAAVHWSSVSDASVREFLAERLYELAAVRDRPHWLRRLDLLLRRPAEEGSAFTVFLDGLSQEPTAPWINLLKVLQGQPFARRVRIVLTTRTLHYQDRLSGLRGLMDRPLLIPVESYSTDAGGELDQMLGFEGLTQAHLQPELIHLACRPRLFNLVIRFRERLVEAGQITVHRLLWEYGRDTYGERTGSFSESDWQAWLKEIAAKYRDGIREYTLKTLSETAARSDLTSKEVSARLSDIVDGRFVVEKPGGALELTPTVVAHALGADLVWRLLSHTPQVFESLEAEVTQWLDPIAGLDQRAEILRAAVSIVVEQGLADSDVAGVLLTAWLQTQNISEKHRTEIAALAPEVAKALLDTVEHSAGAARSSARYWAINSLRTVPRTHAGVRDHIVARVTRWLRVISRDVDLRPELIDGEKRRSERIRRRIGEDVSGPRTVAGVNVELVDQGNDALQATVSPLIEGYPLATMLSIFELAAVALAIRGRIECWQELKWLCYLNEADPEETAEGLRSLSRQILRRPLESGVQTSLPSWIAGYILRLTGLPADEDQAVVVETESERTRRYLAEYLANPARSLFPLERRHAIVALEDVTVPLHVRMQRSARLWLDPTFGPPASIITEITAAAVKIDVEKLGRTRGRTVEDVRFEELEPALARCAPDVLADVIRRRLRSLGSCASDARLCSASSAMPHFILASEAEVAAAKSLRQKERHADDKEESYAACRFLMIEIKDLGALAQFETVISADLAFVLRDLANILHRPAMEEVDILIARHGAGSDREQETLLALLSVHPAELSDTAWQWAHGFAQNLEHRLRPLAFSTLGRVDPLRFGKQLVKADWSWRADEKLWVNHYGSHALIEATRTQPFDEVVPRLAPWCLLAAARLRGADPTEVRVATSILGIVLEAERLEEPDLGSDISVNRVEEKSLPFAYSVEVRQNAEQDPAEAFEAGFDTDAQVKAYDRAAEVAQARLAEARRSGAGLLLVNIEVEDLCLALEHAPEMVEEWLDGYRETTLNFQRRVRLAEAAYLGLCEVLLAQDPARGVQLWRSLRKAISTRYIGVAEVDDVTQMVFRAPSSSQVAQLQAELLSPKLANTDAALFDVALAAQFNGHADWLQARIEEDLASHRVWSQRRGVVLSGFTINNTLPVEGAWPDGPIKTSHAEMRHHSARRRALDACARHWWRAYLAASSPEQAYAAWALFLRSADRRASIWMDDDLEANPDRDFTALKLAYANVNRSEWRRFASERKENWGKKFLGRDIGEGFGPWI